MKDKRCKKLGNSINIMDSSEEQEKEYLYHYTTPEGLIGIVKTKSLWATDTLYLNDTQEFIKGLNLAQKCLEIKMENEEENSRRKIEWLSRQLSLISLSTFVVSFSAEKDQLSQWRAYCPTGGFAIGFPMYGLQQLAHKQGFSLKQCVYEPNQQEELIRNAIDSTITDWVRSPEPLSEDKPLVTYDNAKRFEISNKLIHQLSRVSPLLKDIAFSEEKEWRLICEPGRRYKSEERGFFARRGLVVPYLKFCLGEDKDFWTWVKVVVGPTPHPEESCRSVDDLFRCYHGCRISVEKTCVPYRHW